MLLAQDNDDQDVGNERYGENYGHDVAINGHRPLQGSGPGGTIDVVANAFVETRAQGVDLNLRNQYCPR